MFRQIIKANAIFKNYKKSHKAKDKNLIIKLNQQRLIIYGGKISFFSGFLMQPNLVDNYCEICRLREMRANMLNI